MQVLKNVQVPIRCSYGARIYISWTAIFMRKTQTIRVTVCCGDIAESLPPMDNRCFAHILDSQICHWPRRRLLSISSKDNYAHEYTLDIPSSHQWRLWNTSTRPKDKLACAYIRESNLPEYVAPEHVDSVHGHPCSCANWRHSKNPDVVAWVHVDWFHSHPLAYKYIKHSKLVPTALADVNLSVLHPILWANWRQSMWSFPTAVVHMYSNLWLLMDFTLSNMDCLSAFGSKWPPSVSNLTIFNNDMHGTFNS